MDKNYIYCILKNYLNGKFSILLMGKEVGYVIVIALIALAVLVFYYIGGGPTGYAVIEEYTTETDCVANNYTWENLTEQNCTIETIYVNETIDCEPCLEYEDINGTQGDCITWSSCVNETSTEEETCVDVVIGGQCVGDVCDSNNLNLCLDETNCTGAEGYWYNETCNAEEEPSCSNDVTLCLDEGNCTDVGQGYWYSDVCNELECASDANCASGYECNENGACVEMVEETTEEEEETTEEEEEETTEEVPIQRTQPRGTTQLVGGDIQTLSLGAGNSGSISWTVTNTGTNPISTCKIRPLGEFVSWFSFSDDSANLNKEEGKEFVFDVIVPEGSGEGSYLLSVSVECFETAVAKDFTVDVIIPSLSEAEIGAEEGTPVGGFAIFGEDGIGTGGVVVLIVVVLALVTILFVARRMRRSGKTLKDVFDSFKFGFREQ
jgi:hypothetical protein